MNDESEQENQKNLDEKWKKHEHEERVMVGQVVESLFQVIRLLVNVLIFDVCLSEILLIMTRKQKKSTCNSHSSSSGS